MTDLSRPFIAEAPQSAAACAHCGAALAPGQGRFCCTGCEAAHGLVRHRAQHLSNGALRIVVDEGDAPATARREPRRRGDPGRRDPVYLVVTLVEQGRADYECRSSKARLTRASHLTLIRFAPTTTAAAHALCGSWPSALGQTKKCAP